MVSKLVHQDASGTGEKKKKKAEVLGLGFFHALVSDVQQEEEGMWILPLESCNKLSSTL